MKNYKINEDGQLTNNKLKVSSKDVIKIFNEKSNKKTANEKFFKNKQKNYIESNKIEKEFFKKYLATSLDDLEFHDAIVKDKRKFCEYLCENFKEKQNISYTFCAKDLFWFVQLK